MTEVEDVRTGTVPCADLASLPATSQPSGAAAGERPVVRAALASDPEEEARLRVLVQRVSRAEQKALAELYDLTVARVYGLARAITRNQQCAEEVTEDVYWQVWRQALRFDPRRGPVIAWLQMLARSRALDHLRRGNGIGIRVDADTLDEEQADADLNPSRLLAAAERERTLTAALDQLDPLPRQLLSLAFHRGLTHDEIARQTSLPLGTVKSHIRRALSALRDLLSTPGREEAAP